MRPLTICYFQQTVKKFVNLDILSHFVPKRMEGEGRGSWVFLLSCQNLPFSWKHQKWFFDQKNEEFLSSYFTTDEEIFVVINPSEKQRFQIFSLLSHTYDWKVNIFSKKASNLIACCFWCFTTGPKHPKCWNWKTYECLVLLLCRNEPVLSVVNDISR